MSKRLVKKLLTFYRATENEKGKPLVAVSHTPVEGAEYIGERNAAGQREGRGTARYLNGDVYEGEWRAGRFEGKGIERFSNGNVYTCEYKAGKRDGWGTMNAASGYVYEGEYKAGERKGRGTARYTDGTVYEGEWRAGVKEGHGTYTHASGDVYEGEFKAGKMEGPGTYHWADGNAEVCTYHADKHMGLGVKWSADRQKAARTLDGKYQAEISSIDEARAMTLQIGLPVPESDALQGLEMRPPVSEMDSSTLYSRMRSLQIDPKHDVGQMPPVVQPLVGEPPPTQSTLLVPPEATHSHRDIG